jgi:hypothetical protein
VLALVVAVLIAASAFSIGLGAVVALVAARAALTQVNRTIGNSGTTARRIMRGIVTTVDAEGPI